MTDNSESEISHPKADVLDRVLARCIDMLIAGALSMILPPVGSLGAVLYLLIADGIFDGQSVGKRVIRLRVIHLPGALVAKGRSHFRNSVIRNAPFALVTLLANISIVGWVLLILLGIPLMAVEIYLLATDKHGIRLGDFFADTMVVHVPEE